MSNSITKIIITIILILSAISFAYRFILPNDYNKHGYDFITPTKEFIDDYALTY